MNVDKDERRQMGEIITVSLILKYSPSVFGAIICPVNGEYFFGAKKMKL